MDRLTPPGERTAALAAELRRLISKLKRRIRRRGAIGDLKPSQVSVLLRLLKDGPATASGLARAEGVTPQSIASTVAPLQAQGLVEASPDPADGRQTLLSLTGACRQALAEHRAAREDWLAGALAARLSPEEQDQVAGGIALLMRLVDD